MKEPLHPTPPLSAAADDAAEALLCAIELHQAGHLPDAEIHYRRVLAAQPDHPEALYRLAALVRETGRPLEYIELIGAALATAPEDKFGQLNLGNAYLDLADPGQAAACYRRALAIDPDFAEAHHNLGLACNLLERFNEAIACYRQALALKPDYIAAHLNLAGVLNRLERFDEAAACYRAVLELQPQSAETHYNLGCILQTQRQFDQALTSYRQAIALKPAHFVAYANFATTLHALERYDEAIAVYRALLARAPGHATAFDHSETYNNLGAALKNQDRTDEAIACFHQALAIKPDYAKALFNLGTIYFVRKDFPAAMKWYQASLAVDPHQLEAHQNMSAILLAAGRLDEAQQHRDLAYRKQALFIDTAPDPGLTVLVLWAAGTGNVPIDFLLPLKTVTRLVWMMEYANEEQERGLPPYDLVFNAIGDEDAVGPTREPVARFLAHCRKPVLNLPAAITDTARDRIPALFASIPDLLLPITVRLDTAHLKDSLLAQPGIRLPLLVRPGGSHGGDQLFKLESIQALDDLVPFPSPFYYATNYHDYVSADGYYRKYRIVFIDRQPYPYHLALGKHWMVHYETADMLSEDWKREEEVRFLAHPAHAIGAAAMAAIAAIGRTLDLDYCGLDFSLLSDGRVLVFEANATMLVHPEDSTGIFDYKNPYVQRIFDAFNTLLERKTTGNRP